MAGLFVWTYLGVGLEGVNEVRGELDRRVAIFLPVVLAPYSIATVLCLVLCLEKEMEVKPSASLQPLAPIAQNHHTLNNLQSTSQYKQQTSEGDPSAIGRILPREDMFRAGLSLRLRAAGAHCAFCAGAGASSEL